MTHKYATPERFKTAVETRIRTAAAAAGKDMNRVRQVIIYSRFLARVFHALGDAAIAKGGVVMELRMEHARATRDVDLRVAGSGGDAIRKLQEAGSMDLGDWMTFVIEPDKEHPAITAEGMVLEGRRFRAECRVAGKLYGMPFGVDVAFGDAMSAPAELLDGSDFLVFAGVERPRFRVYPRAVHVAEKLHAYTLPRKRENSRVKDLPDMALLAQTGPFTSAELQDALRATFPHRGTHPLPAELPPPPTSWGLPYAQMARTHGLAWPGIDEVYAAAKAFLDPVLAGADGAWDPAAWTWR